MDGSPEVYGAGIGHGLLAHGHGGHSLQPPHLQVGSSSRHGMSLISFSFDGGRCFPSCARTYEVMIIC